MAVQLEDITGKFQVISIEAACVQDENYTLPRNVTLKLNGNEEVQAIKAKEIVKVNKIGNIKRVYEENGRRFIEIDEVEWYSGEQAIKEAEKDGLSPDDVTDDYYIRDKDHNLTTYELAENATFKIVQIEGGVTTEDLSFDNFSSYAAERMSDSNSGIFYYIYCTLLVIWNTYIIIDKFFIWLYHIHI